ncbi:MAG: outer membrane beta-barrel protein [Paracoccaceae bacterium]|nr:outer membrane beta-barrel protein [Paracoccaceae bacterium]
MNRKIWSTVAATCLMAASASAQGLPGGLYVSGFGGINAPGDQTSSITGLADNFGDMSFDHGTIFGAAIGYSPIPGLRAEVELSRRNADVSSYFEGGFSANNALPGDSIKALSIMANLWKDVDVGNNVTAHFGGGVGMSRLSLNMGDLTSYKDPMHDSDTVVAGQLGAGLAFNLGNNMTLTLDYRYLRTADATFTNHPSCVECSPYSLKQNYDDHAVFVGLRIPLGQK